MKIYNPLTTVSAATSAIVTSPPDALRGAVSKASVSSIAYGPAEMARGATTTLNSGKTMAPADASRGSNGFVEKMTKAPADMGRGGSGFVEKMTRTADFGGGSGTGLTGDNHVTTKKRANSGAVIAAQVIGAGPAGFYGRINQPA